MANSKQISLVATGKRWLIATFALIIFIACGGARDFYLLVTEISKSLGALSWSASLPWGLSVELPSGQNSLTVIGKTFFSVVSSWLFVSLFLKAQDKRFEELFNYYEEKEKGAKLEFLIEMLRKKSGIQEIYSPEIGKPLTQQDYVSDVEEAYAKSNRCWLMTIAGYEYIGRKKKSLLWNWLKTNDHVSIKVILLDADKAQPVISKRAEDLRKIDNNYCARQLKEEISQTENLLKELAVRRKPHANAATINLFKTSLNPVFRLLIFDDTMFVSTYERNCHGHESPLYRIIKPDALDGDQLSLFNSFEALFDNVASQSQHVAF